MAMQIRGKWIGLRLPAFALLVLTALATGCPPEEENPYVKQCRWMAGDADECLDIASSKGCFGTYDPDSLVCLGEDCMNCDVTGVTCPEQCAKRGLGSNGYRETNRQACLDRIQELVWQGYPAKGGYLIDVQCCCLPS